ncbi:hypothetical protein K402DRAFT_399612 [Aulographum hederae CBS 113979]|uniref:Uncharacterized protein n=1 Tax=Aulographum hederae CBS 113979 TaxID=1176131 RepID=A0A6G1HHK3_9PEZI|nr:hypothetical protein K402DRAFT_399612 [Aulographum hederae CBS 113979]
MLVPSLLVLAFGLTASAAPVALPNPPTVGDVDRYCFDPFRGTNLCQEVHPDNSRLPPAPVPAVARDDDLEARNPPTVGDVDRYCFEPFRGTNLCQEVHPDNSRLPPVGARDVEVRDPPAFGHVDTCIEPLCYEPLREAQPGDTIFPPVV